MALLLDFFLGNSGKPCNHVIREFNPLGLCKKLRGQPGLAFPNRLKGLFHFHQDGKLVNEPQVNPCDFMDIFIGNASAQGLGNPPDPHVVHLFQLFPQLTVSKSGKVIGQEAVHMLFQGTDCLHQSAFKVGADTHDLAGGLHLGSQGTLGAYEFIEREPWHLDHAVIQHWLKACICLFCDRVLNLIQGITQGNLGSNLGNGVSGCLAGQCRGTAYPGVYLDDAVLKAVRVQGILHIAAAGNPQFADDIQGRGT